MLSYLICAIFLLPSPPNSNSALHALSFTVFASCIDVNSVVFNLGRSRLLLNLRLALSTLDHLRSTFHQDYGALGHIDASTFPLTICLTLAEDKNFCPFDQCGAVQRSLEYSLLTTDKVLDLKFKGRIVYDAWTRLVKGPPKRQSSISHPCGVHCPNMVIPRSPLCW